MNNESGENATFFRDWSSYANNGTCSGTSCPSYNSDGKFGSAYTFDGINDTINLGDILDEYTSGANKKWTYSIWLKRNGIGTDDMIIGKWQSGDPNREYQMYFDTTSKIIFFSDRLGDFTNNMYSTTTSTFTSTSNWYHLAFVWDYNLSNASRQAIYVNGVSQATTVVGNITSIYNGIRNLTIGADSGGIFNFN